MTKACFENVREVSPVLLAEYLGFWKVVEFIDTIFLEGN